MSPKALKPGPLGVATPNVTGTVPVLVRTTVPEPLEPTVTLPKLTEEMVAVGVVPIPARLALKVPVGEEVVVTLKVEVAVPFDLGEKVKLKVQVPPAATVPWQVSDSAKSVESDSVGVLNVIGVEPLFESVAAWAAVVELTGSAPKDSEAGVRVTSGAKLIRLRKPS